MIHGWAVHMANFLGAELNLEQRKIAIAAYGLEVLTGALIKLAVFIIVPYLLGILKLFAVVMISFGIIRLPAGGIHCNAYYKCVLSSLFFFLAIAFTAQYLSAFTLPVYEILYAVLVVVWLVCSKLAPVDVKEKPIKSEKRRLRLKVISCTLPFIYGAVLTYWRPGQDIVLACLLSLLFHTFTLTKPGHKFFGWVDSAL